MTDLRQAAQQALEALEFDGFTPEDTTHRYYTTKAITAMREALEQQPEQEPVARVDEADDGFFAEILPDRTVKVGQLLYAAPPLVQEPVACRFCHDEKGCWTWQCYNCGEIDDVQQPAAPPKQEPVAWGWRYDSCGHAVVNRLVATETSEPTLFLKNVFARGPFPLYAAPQLEQEPVGKVVEINNDGFRCEFNRRLAVGTKLYTAPPLPAQPVQEPWGACVSGRVFVGALPEHVRKLTEDDGLPIQLLYTAPPQRPWVGLTDEEIAQGNKESWVTEQAWQSAVWWAEAKLKEKNNG
jgi:hypothetical protein